MTTLNFSYARLFHKSLACFLAFCMVNLPVWALNVNDATVAAGNANKSQSGNTVNVDLITQRAVLDWTQMNALSNETLNFTGSSGFAVLNRVASAVDFNGTLNSAGGHVFIVSPHGVLLGADAKITANSFTAAGLDISNQNFMNGIQQFQPFAGGMVGDVTNYAIIDNVTEQVSFLGKSVLNEGSIILPDGGVAVMAAGESVYLGEPGGKIIIEMTGIEGGLVTNSAAGTIEAPDGKVILAAGDIYSIPLHPQLQVNAGTVDAPVYNVDDQPVRAETGHGTVVQAGAIGADGANGEVILTAGDDVVLTSGSEVSVTEGTFTAYANDFGNFDSKTLFNDDAAVYIDGGEAQFYGNHLLYAGDTIAEAGATLHLGSQELTIANGLRPATPSLNTIYEKMVEAYSNQGIDLNLAGDNQITVKYMADGQIAGGSGDIYLRNVYEDGGIYFERQNESAGTGPRTTLRTTAYYVSSSNYRDGGSIYMDSGSGGIVAGDIFTNTISNDKVSQPGEIMLRSGNGGDIEVGTMKALGAFDTQVSAIASGDLIVHGDAVSENKQVDNDNQTVARAILCLIAGGDITLEGQNYSVISHGKYETTADIRISAGDDLQVGSASQPATISAEAKTSESKNVTKSTASVIVRAGTAQDGPGTIIINGVTYVAGQSFLSNNKLYAKAWPGPLGVDSSSTPTSTSGTQTTWQESGTPAENFFARITIDNNAEGPCVGCPVPPGLPPVPHIFWLVDDDFQTNWRSGNIAGFDPAELDVLLNDSIKFDPTVSLVNYSITTAKGGTLTLVQVEDPGTGQMFWAFSYTPPTDQPFVWDGTSDYATFTDSFEYQATKEINGKTVLSKNTASVEIAVTNFLPTLADDSATIHMSTTGNSTSANFDLSTLIVDPDGTPGMITTGLVEGLIPVANGWIATDSTIIPDTLTISGDTITYNPLDGYVSPTGSPTTFGYSVIDSSIVSAPETPVEQTANLDVTVTNTLPGGSITLEDAHMNAGILGNDAQTLGVAGGGTVDPDGDVILDTIITPATDDYNMSYGGDLVDNGDGTFDYSADPLLPGYVGEDNFDAHLWDGQKTYYTDGSSDNVYATGDIYVNVTNERPSGDVWLGTTNMDTGINDGAIVSGSFDDDGDMLLSIVVTGPSSDDYNQGYGGDLVYNGDGTYDYSPDATLPGYTGDKVDNFNDPGYVISDNADDRFNVKLWDGEYHYVFDVAPEGKEKPDFQRTAMYGEGTVSLDMVNDQPEGDAWFGQVHMDDQNVNRDLAMDFGSGVTVENGTYTGSVIGDDSQGGTLVFDGTNWTYSTDTGLPGYVGDGNDEYGQPGYVADDLFTVDISNGEFDYWFGEGPAPEGYELYGPAEIYRKAVTSEGTISVDITNIKPTAQGDLGEVGTQSGPITQNGTTSPVLVIDPFDSHQTQPDIHTLVPGTYKGSNGGTLVFNGSAWVYTPAEGFSGQETFTINVWDGQNMYVDGQNVGPDYGKGTVLVSVSGTTPEIPVAPLADLRLPELKGCPALMDAAATELAINSDELQMLISNSLASNPNLQPCDACESLLNASSVLKDADGQKMAALSQIFSTLAPANAPFTPEMSASIATAFADMAENDAQYAMAGDYVDAFVSYVAVLERDLKMPVGDPVALVLEKYGKGITGSDNPNLAAYIAAQLTAGGSM